MSSPSYTPDESQATIIQEETWLQGSFLSNFFFGIQITLFLMTFRTILQRRTPERRRLWTILLIYVSVLFAITTAQQGLLLEWIQMAFITQREYPGGPSVYLIYSYAFPLNLSSNILVVCANWMMESLLVWRCYIVCSSGGRLWWFGIAFPFVFLIAVVVSSSIFLHFNTHTLPPVSATVAYGISSLLLNLTATGFIVGRLFVYRRRIVSQLGRVHGQHYVSIAAVVVESVALYTSFVVLVIVAYATKSPAANLLQQVIEQVQTIASLLILLRIARGEGWTKSTDTELVSTAVSSFSARTGMRTEQNVINLQVVAAGHDGEEVNVPRKQGERAVSFVKETVV